MPKLKVKESIWLISNRKQIKPKQNLTSLYCKFKNLKADNLFEAFFYVFLSTDNSINRNLYLTNRKIFALFVVINLFLLIVHRPNGRVTNVFDFWRGTLDSNPKFVKPSHVAVAPSPMQPCILCLGASCSNVLRKLITHNRYGDEYNENLILVLINSIADNGLSWHQIFLDDLENKHFHLWDVVKS